MKLIKSKFIISISLMIMILSLFISGIATNLVSAAGTTPKIYVDSSGANINNTASVTVNVQIATLGGETSPGPNAFYGDTIEQNGNDFYILDSSGNQVDQIPSTISLGIIDTGSGNSLGTYCGTSSETTLPPCGSDYLVPGNSNIGNTNVLSISPSGVIPYSANFEALDEFSAPNAANNSDNFVGCPSGTNISISPACNTSAAAQKVWTVQSCSVTGIRKVGNGNISIGAFGSTCVTTLPNTSVTPLSGISLTLPLPANYQPPSDLAASAINSDQSPGSQAPSCDESGFVLDWIFCPIIDGMVDGITYIYTNLIKPELQVTPIVTSPPAADCTTDLGASGCDPAHSYEIWSSFRLYGNIVLVLAILFLVFAEIIGGGIIDAYTLKKMLPRILIAAILINLSIYIVAALIDVSNVIGSGITYLIDQPFANAGANTIKFGDLSGVLGGVGVAGSIWAIVAIGTAVLPFLLLFILLPAFVAIIGVILTILLRQALVILLVLSAPIAFALYCLPNTEQYFKKWWSLLFKTLLIFPIVSAFFALSTALAITISSTGGSDPVTQILAVIALFVPLFLIPFAFKIAGGILGGVYGAVNSTGKKFTEAIKGNPNDPNSLRNRSRRQILERATEIQGKFVEPGYNAMGNTAKDRRQRAVTRVANLFGNYAARSAGYNEAAAKRREQITNFGNDDLVFAGGGYTTKAGEVAFDGSIDPGKDRYYTSKGKEINKPLYSKGKSLYGGSQHDVTQALGYATYKAQTDKDFGAVQFAFNRNAEAGGWDQSQITGNYLGATFPYKGRSVFLRYEIPKLDSGTRRVSNPNVLNDDKPGNEAYYGGIKQMHKSGEAFKLSTVSDKDWMSMATKQQQLESKVIAGTQTAEDVRNLAMTYEIMDAASQKIRNPNYTEESIDEAGNTTVVAGGASPASQGVIEEAVNKRRFDLKTENDPDLPPPDPSTPPDLITMQKHLVPKRGVGTDETPSPYTYTTGPTVE